MKSAAGPLGRSLVSAGHCSLFLLELGQRGIAAGSALACAGIGQAEVRLDVMLEEGDFAHFLDAVHALTQDDDVGLRAGQRIELGHLDLMGILLRSSAHGRDAIRKLISHRDIWRNAYDAEVRLAAREVRVVHTPFRTRATPRLAIDMVLSRSVRCAELLAAAPPPSKVSFTYSQPRDISVHRSIFGTARLEFGASTSAVVYSTDHLLQPFRYSDAAISAVVEPHVARLAGEARDVARDLTIKARAFIADELRGGGASLQKLARVLYVSERHLRRQLDELGTSYRALLDQVRRERAAQELARSPGATGAELSEQLGFADPTTFYRAYKRWTGARWSERRETGNASGSSEL